MSKEKFSFYKEHPKTCQDDDFWGQVKRTVNGAPVSQEQIDMIVVAVANGLQLNKQDSLLDMCCGNGALSTLLFQQCQGGLGVDFSEHLISIANTYFSTPPTDTYILGDVVEFCAKPKVDQKIFTKALCYGSFAYIEHERAELLLRSMHQNFQNIERFFIGNLPDKDHLQEFYHGRSYESGIENDPDSAIGIWRTQGEFIAMAKRCGWQAEITKMPEEYYSSHYRYDVVLFR